MSESIPTLFELRDEDTIRHDAIALNRQRIHDVICGNAPWPLSDRQRRVLEIVRYRQGRDQAIPSADLENKLQLCDRKIRACIRELVVDFHLAIVASRTPNSSGYFFATTAEERHTYSADYLKEACKLIRRAQIIRNELDVNVLFGQIALDLKEGEKK